MKKVEVKSHKEGHSWQQLDGNLKRAHNSSVNHLCDSHHPDQDKGQLVEDNRSQADKPKAADAKKRGRPRKSVKSPKHDHRTPDENLKSGKARSRTRAVGGQSLTKRKQPISKATLPTSDDDSDDSRSQGVSSDSVSDHRSNNVPNNVAAPMQDKRIRLSLSSSDDDSPPNRKRKNSASEEETARWRGVAIKRSKLADTKKQDKRKSPAKGKSRRSRSRMTNVTGGSDSESESGMSVRSRIQVAR